MTWKYQILAMITLMLVPSWALAADGQSPAREPTNTEQVGLYPRLQFDASGRLVPVVRGQSPYRGDVMARFGWWGTSTDGDLTKVGEYQDLESSPFWDVDVLSSDGTTTLDAFATGTDNEGTQLGAHYFAPDYSGRGFSIDVRYDRYLRRLDHDPLENFSNELFPSQPRFDAEEGNLTDSGSLNRSFMQQDLNVGEDYAIRVQEFETSFKGRLTDNVKWRINLWGMRKHGERQARAQSHCFDADTVDTGTPTVPPVPDDARACHMLSQRQRIDWFTMEIEPVVEGRWGPLSVEYSRTMRGFSQNDDLVSRNHTTNNIERSIGDVGDGAVDQDPANDGTVVGYAFVPDSYFDMDRLKIGLDVREYTDFYALLYRGNMHNENRETDRQVSGFDLRLTDRSIAGMSITGYAKKQFDNGEEAPFVAPDGTEVIPVGADAGATRLEHPWERDKTSVGFKGRWRRLPGSRHSLVGGYDYTLMDRSFTEHETEHTGPADEEFVWTQTATIYHTLRIGINSRWSSSFDTYIRYKRQWIRDPMFAAHEPNGVTNSNLPTDVDLVEFGGTWTPAYNFLLNAMVGIENRSHSSAIADFEEDNYPMTFTAWYAPSTKWSLSAGYGYYTNWIDQDITLGDQTDRWVDKGTYWRHYLGPETTRWSYGGEAQVVNFGSRYAWTEYLSLTGSVEWMRGRDRFFSPSPAAYDLSPTGTPSFPVTPDWSDLPNFSDVIVETTRISAGVDCAVSENVTCYFRYNYFDYEDESVGRNSGTAHMFLGGLAGTF